MRPYTLAAIWASRLVSNAGQIVGGVDLQPIDSRVAGVQSDAVFDAEVCQKI